MAIYQITQTSWRKGGSVYTVVAEMITELIHFEPKSVSVIEINWTSRENLYL